MGVSVVSISCAFNSNLQKDLYNNLFGLCVIKCTFVSDMHKHNMEMWKGHTEVICVGFGVFVKECSMQTLCWILLS